MYPRNKAILIVGAVFLYCVTMSNVCHPTPIPEEPKKVQIFQVQFERFFDGLMHSCFMNSTLDRTEIYIKCVPKVDAET